VRHQPSTLRPRLQMPAILSREPLGLALSVASPFRYSSKTITFTVEVSRGLITNVVALGVCIGRPSTDPASIVVKGVSRVFHSLRARVTNECRFTLRIRAPAITLPHKESGTITDTQNEATRIRILDRIHNRRETSERSGP